jgi:maltooligosyltrehalose trehalohydrolase
VYRTLARLRRTHPDLTDPRFDRVACTVDEDTRLFRMRRGALEIVVNFGDSPLTVPLGAATDLLFATGDDVLLTRSSLTLPPHAGALLR